MDGSEHKIVKMLLMRWNTEWGRGVILHVTNTETSKKVQQGILGYVGPSSPTYPFCNRRLDLLEPQGGDSHSFALTKKSPLTLYIVTVYTCANLFHGAVFLKSSLIKTLLQCLPAYGFFQEMIPIAFSTHRGHFKYLTEEREWRSTRSEIKGTGF